MYSKQKLALQKLFSRGFPFLKWLMILVLVWNLSSCVEPVKSQEVSVSRLDQLPPTAQISGQFSETAPPEVIQELRSALEVYQPQVKILSPLQDEILLDDTVTVSLQVKDLPIFKDPQWQLGPHLHLILDNQVYQPVYDLNQPLVLPHLLPGTHTLRVFASRPWHESFKNEGAFAQTTFHIFTKTEDNNPDPNLPLLTYSRPQGSYGAEPIMLDFYLTNAPLHAVAEDHPEDTVSNWRIRCTINGESFIFDRWQTVYLRGLKPGKNWVKLEFLDNQGNSVKNTFNTTARLFTYEPNGQDTLSRIVRGELTADEVRSIVDPNYKTKIPPIAPTPVESPKVEETQAPQPQLKEQPSKIEVSPAPEIAPIPTASPTPIQPEEIQPEVQPEVAPIQPEEIQPEVQPEIAPIQPEEIQPEIAPTPTASPTPIQPEEIQPEVQPEISPNPTTQPTSIPQPELTPTPPASTQPEPQPEVIPIPPKFTNQPETELKSSSSPLPTPETSSTTSPVTIYP